MSFWFILYTIFLRPLRILFEVIFGFSNVIVSNYGLSIICLSLAINLLVLPLYRRADAMQEEERDIEMRLKKGVDHIKKTFKGDERMMMTQAYYRQNNYKPTYVLRSATSLLLQIPFFIAAYQFLSTCSELNGFTFGLIKDLGQPDGLLQLGGLKINILPVIMTLINIISSAIYSKNYPMKTKIQLYSMAAFFLVFLYKSPSGLVFYWTLNNAFSLVKTIVLKQKNPKQAIKWLFSLLGAGILFYDLASYKKLSTTDFAVFIYFAFLCQTPLIFSMLKKKGYFKSNKEKVKKDVEYTPDRKIFIISCLFLTALRGLVIPSNLIKSSPQEFVFLGCYQNPIWYIVSTFCLAIGTYLIWFSVFYWLASPKAKVFFDRAVFIICGVSILNYMCFGRNLGTLSTTLKYLDGYGFELPVHIACVLSSAAVGILMYFLLKKFRNQASYVVTVCVTACVVLSVINTVGISSDVKKINKRADLSPFTIELSKTEKNVVFIMLDRAMGEYIPYILDERPELKEKFDGFTYYSNIISFGGTTNLASPALYGGYEYTPIELNSRKDKLLVEKHNESLKVMPVLFDKAGYDVTVCNPSYANYEWIPDLSIYDDYPDIKTCNVTDDFTDPEFLRSVIDSNRERIFLFSIMKCTPLFIQATIYNGGTYYQTGTAQKETSPYEASGQYINFLNAYNILKSMPKVTKATDSKNGSFFFMTNDTTHEPMLLQMPDYVPAENVDNKAFASKEYTDRTVNGVTLRNYEYNQNMHYQSNMAAYLQLAKWLDHLRELGIYDNTKIILCSDHGFFLDHIAELVAEYDETLLGDTEAYYPLLMVKDFNAKGFTVSDEFMTNADVPSIAFNDIVDNPVNPFTGKLINSDEKTAHKQYIIASHEFSALRNCGEQFLPGRWYTVEKDRRDMKNWEKVADDAVLDKEEYKSE